MVDMINDCFNMNDIARMRRKKRMASGSLTLANREFVFRLDDASKLP